ncbi:WD40-repeat-containing domain protein [Kalaharituber pfeilii]|nr:WD40-repeat-containing domain protein [Kalaharituber pfeilii]
MPPPKHGTRIKKDDEADEDDITIEEPLLDPNDPMRAFLPTSFGKQTGARDVSVEFEKTKRGGGTEEKNKGKGKVFEKQAKGKERKGDEDEEEEEDDTDDDESEDEEDEFPISHEIVLKSHTKSITSISLDPSGTRLITASHDYTVKFFDFPSMSPDTLNPFRSIEPSESHHIHSAIFSDDGQSILVVPAATQAKVLSRDGETLVEFVKGDMYLRDMHHTKGHISEITAGCWHPTDVNRLVTAGTDSTLRIWDVNNKRTHKDVIVYKSKTAKGGRSRMCCVAWAPGEGGAKSMLGTVAMDGAMLIYPGDGPFTRPSMEVKDAHTRESWTSSLAFSPDSRLIVTKGGDQTIKLWDVRKLKLPMNTREFASPPQPESNIIFSPNSSSLLTGDASGNLHILSPATLRSEKVIPITPNHPLVTVNWHPKINQILTGSSTGAVNVLYSPEKSSKGAKLVVTRAPKKRHIDDDPTFSTDLTSGGLSEDTILLPNALLGRPKGGISAQLGGKKKSPMAPELPAPTPWGKSNPDQEHVKKAYALSSMRDEDPREALLKYAEVASKDPIFTAAWSKTQPKTIYANVSEDEEEEPSSLHASKRQKR